jgi:hypothetical protein
MSMRKTAFSIVAVIALECVFAQPSTNPLPWTATVKVVDESGTPVTGADVEVGYYVTPPPDQTVASEKIQGLTDTNGVFTASHADRSISIGFRAARAGYYSSTAGHTLFLPGQFDEATVVANRRPTVTLLLRRIGKPIPMYAKFLNLGMPVFDKPAGFDLTKGDWVSPYGSGAVPDIIFTAHREKRSEYDVDYKLVVSFPNPGDGIQEFSLSELEKTSALRSPHDAPADGYQPEWVQTSVRRPGQPVQTNRDEKRNYIFRVRTVLDEHGNVKSANYGKIYGDFLQFRYYLNPTPNDRSIEFDPSRNLFSERERGGAAMNAP